ncbi:MAG: hypothetical protein JSV16_13965, partial [Candidatus Hydrogenedentota bacterium]
MTDSAFPFRLVRKLTDRRTHRACGRVSQRLVASFSLLIVGLSSATVAGDSAEGAAAKQVYCSAGEEEVVWRFVLWPFIAIEETAEWRQFAFRPIYVEREAADDSEKKVQFLWPIYLYRRSDQDVTIRVLPVYTYRRDVYAYKDGHEYDVDYMLFPFVYGGSSTEEGGYFALFPVAGKLKNFLGRDEIRFFLFPLYVEYSKDELRQRNYLWPVLSFSGGGDYSGLRVWPLFGYFEKRGEYRKEFWLWPIFHHQTFDLDREQSGERLLIFPLYARE